MDLQIFRKIDELKQRSFTDEEICLSLSISKEVIKNMTDDSIFLEEMSLKKQLHQELLKVFLFVKTKNDKHKESIICGPFFEKIKDKFLELEREIKQSSKLEELKEIEAEICYISNFYE